MSGYKKKSTLKRKIHIERTNAADIKYAQNMIKEITTLRDIGHIGQEFAQDQIKQYESILQRCGKSR